jgi:hypothetical protein
MNLIGGTVNLEFLETVVNFMESALPSSHSRLAFNIVSHINVV